jgi:ADP-heptose:LPS heptosyltransferase
MKLLLIRFSSIGDIVLTTPVIRCTKQQANGGDVEIHYLTKRKYQSILQPNPHIDRLITIDNSVTEVADQLKAENYDLIIDLHNNLRSHHTRRLLSTPAHQFKKLSFKKWLYATFKLNLMPDAHVVDRYMDTVSSLNVRNDHKGLDYFITPEDSLDKSTLPATHQKDYIGFVIGGQHEGKLYPAEKVAQVCRLLERPVILLGGPEDRERGDTIAKAAGEMVYNSCGRYSLNQSATLVRDADCIITNDTGLMHIAAALKKRVISIWGATVPQFGMYPYQPGPGSRMLEPSRECDRPYSKLGNKVFYKPAYNCWKGLEPEVVAAAVLAAQENENA